MQAELESAIQDFKEQLAAVEGLLSDNPQDEEAQQVYAELADALAAAEAGYAACFSADGNSPAAFLETQPTNVHEEEKRNQHSAGRSGDDAVCGAVPASGSAAARTTAIPAVAALAHPGRSLRRMHPANLYCNQEPDFAALAELHPPFAPYVTVNPASGRASIDFTSWTATKELTAALLTVDFGIHWTLPEGQLVPPVPNRANYIHWLHDLLQLSAPTGPLIRGLDIGCGANLIYCLLGAALYGWHMTGVDVTQVALDNAAAICEANPHMQGLLEIRRSRCTVGQLPSLPLQQQPQQHDSGHNAPNAPEVLGPLLGAMANEQETFAFCMCNPPFFASIREANQNPNTACGGTAEEMVVQGGELAFIRAMIADSQKLRARVHWYSSLCGKKASLKVLRQELHNAGVTALRTTELVQGKTSRWAIAWSFAASPNTANMPLPRSSLPKQQQQHPQQQHPQKQQQQHPCRLEGDIRARSTTTAAATARKLSFCVTAAAADGTKLLQAIAALLGAVAKAQQIQVDSSNWRVTCMLPAANTTLQQHLPQMQQQAAGGSSDQAMAPPSKRLRTEASSGQQCTGSASDSRVVPVEVSVYQQQKGNFDVVVVIKGQVGRAQMGPKPDSAAFVAAFEAVREDLTLMWPVGALQLV